MSYNLVKNFNTVVPNEDKVMIDSNEIIAQKLQVYRETHPQNAPGGFQAGLAARQIDVVENEEGLPREEGETDIPVEEFDASQFSAPVYEGPDPRELVAEAEEEIAHDKSVKAPLVFENLSKQIVAVSAVFAIIFVVCAHYAGASRIHALLEMREKYFSLRSLVGGDADFEA